MLDEIAEDFAAYLKLDLSSEFLSVQDVIDNMLTRLEELGSVLQMIKIKNSECGSIVSEEIIKYRSEVTILSKKISTINTVVHKLNSNIDQLEKQVGKAEMDFKAYNDNKIKSFLKPFLKKNIPESLPSMTHEQFESVMINFENTTIS